jgi:cupin 2 domain-containing protein
MQERRLARFPEGKAMTGPSHGSVFGDLPDAARSERFEELWRTTSFRIERITSSGQSSPPGFYYDQAWDEWVLVLQGWAIVHLEDPEEAIHLSCGDWLIIGAHRRHRVQATSQTPPTIWLAVHAIDA